MKSRQRQQRTIHYLQERGVCFGIGGSSADAVVAVLSLVCVWTLAPFLVCFVFMFLCLAWEDMTGRCALLPYAVDVLFL